MYSGYIRSDRCFLCTPGVQLTRLPVAFGWVAAKRFFFSSVWYEVLALSWQQESVFFEFFFYGTLYRLVSVTRIARSSKGYIVRKWFVLWAGQLFEFLNSFPHSWEKRRKVIKEKYKNVPLIDQTNTFFTHNSFLFESNGVQWFQVLKIQTSISFRHSNLTRLWSLLWPKNFAPFYFFLKP